jgi:hypothetical protein
VIVPAIICYLTGVCVWVVWAGLHWFDRTGPGDNDRQRALLVLACVVWPVVVFVVGCFLLAMLVRDVVGGSR